MRRFAQLFAEIDRTTRTNDKVEAMTSYFATADAADAAWAVYFLSGGTAEAPHPRAPALVVGDGDRAQVPEWLFDECYDAVGDLAETISLLLPPASQPRRSLAARVDRAARAPAREDSRRRRSARASSRAGAQLDGTERFVWNKLITGGFRVGVSHQLVVRALSRASGMDEGTIAHRLTGHWTPHGRRVPRSHCDGHARRGPLASLSLLSSPTRSRASSRSSATRGEWQLEWKWDGIRAQLIRREGKTYLWSRGDELVTDRFPEIAAAAEFLPDGTVIDGEIMPWANGAPLPFAQLQRRIGRTKLGPKILADVPVVLIAYDLLEVEGRDVRGEPLAWRRAALADAHRRAHAPRRDCCCRRSLRADSWDEAREAHARSREQLAEGLMLKRRDSAYGVGRRKGGWWKWKVQPFSVDAVMIYAQAGHGRRASLHTDYTFAVWRDGVLVPIREGVFGSHRRGDSRARWLDSPQHDREVRPGASRAAGARVRARVRGHSGVAEAQVGHRRALSAHRALAQGQARV